MRIPLKILATLLGLSVWACSGDDANVGREAAHGKDATSPTGAGGQAPVDGGGGPIDGGSSRVGEDASGKDARSDASGQVTCTGIAPCGPGSTWSPADCRCVADVADASTTDADAEPCIAAKLCVRGLVWSPVECQCVPETSGVCLFDSNCHLEASYCGGCNCLAFAGAATQPPCTGNEIQCVPDPCAGRVAACVNGSCVVQ